MNQEQAIRRLHAAMNECNAAGWVITGRLELVKPRDQTASQRNAVTANYGSIDNVETATVIATVDVPHHPPRRPLTLAEATVIAAVHPLSSNTGDICSKCGGSSFRRAGTCLYCNNCGESNGCS